MGQKSCCCNKDGSENKEIPDNMPMASMAAGALPEDFVEVSVGWHQEGGAPKLIDPPFPPKVTQQVVDNSLQTTSGDTELSTRVPFEAKDIPVEIKAVEVPKNRNEFAVTLRKTETQNTLGIRADASTGVCLVIHAIEDGLISDWNEANPQQAVQLGDRLMSVNEWRGNVDDLVAECNSSDVLEMVFVHAKH